MRFLKRLFAVAVFLSAATMGAHADNVLDVPAPAGLDDCPIPRAETPLATEYGSAGFIKNMAESPDSIRAIAAGLLGVALTDDAQPAVPGCDPSCPVGQLSEVVYRVAPVAFLPDEKQHEVCLTFEKQTSETPMLFDPRSFASVDDLNEWMTAFSQGRGEDGRLLYERCGSNCSPRYTFFIASEGAGYQVKAEVLCGLARDKSNDQYLISTALRQRCVVN